jgi:CDP-diacylglycerol pyrophosphatase
MARFDARSSLHGIIHEDCEAHEDREEHSPCVFFVVIVVFAVFVTAWRGAAFYVSMRR